MTTRSDVWSLPAEQVKEVLLYTCASLSEWSSLICACRTLTKYGNASAPFLHELRTLRGPQGLSVLMSPSGMRHLCVDTILPWARAFSPRLDVNWGSEQDWEAAVDRFGAYIWLVDICLCSCEFAHHHEYARKSSQFPNEIVSSPEWCPSAQALWRGVAGKPYVATYAGPAVSQVSRVLRLSLHARFELPLDLCWDDLWNYYQVRLFGIKTPWDYLNVDTRHSWMEEGDRIFSAGEGCHCIGFTISPFSRCRGDPWHEMEIMIDAGEVLEIEFLEVTYSQAKWKGSDVWQMV